MTEKDFEKKVRGFIKTLDEAYVLPKIEHPNLPIPDILFTMNGKLFAIELKVKKRYTKREKLQYNFLQKLESKGISTCIMSPEEFEFFKECFSTKNKDLWVRNKTNFIENQ